MWLNVMFIDTCKNMNKLYFAFLQVELYKTQDVEFCAICCNKSALLPL